MSKSPLTERINDSLASSGFAIAGKGCGCDAMVVVGRAAELSVLIVDEASCQSRACSRLSRSNVPGDRPRSRLISGAYRIASIGPAGEHLVRYATISHDGRHAGRGERRYGR